MVKEKGHPGRFRFQSCVSILSLFVYQESVEALKERLAAI